MTFAARSLHWRGSAIPVPLNYMTMSSSQETTPTKVIRMSMSSGQETTRTRMVRKQIRGSGLLLSGSFLSLGIGFCTQLLIARHLSVTAYGMWAYAFPIATLCSSFSRLGMVDAVARFVPRYQEEGDDRRLFGTILLGSAAVLVAALGIVSTFYVAPHHWLAPKNEQAWDLLRIAILMVPMEVADGLLTALFACFAKPRAIFFRRHLLSPGLKLAVVLLLIWRGSSVVFLAYGYLLASVVRVAIYCYLLWAHLKKEGLLQRLHWGQIIVPAREMFNFAIPGLTSDVVSVLYQAAAPLVLGWFYPISAVGFYRVVVPAAVMNTTVMTAFTLLYTPQAARLLAKRDLLGINVLYWKTALWVSVLSFPIFAATFCFARPVTLFLYGPRYEQSAAVLMILAVGYYFNAALGMNGLTLKVLGKLRYLVITNVVIALVNIGACLLLIPRYGVIGAAIATSGTMILHNLIKQFGLRTYAGTRLIERQYVSIYALGAVCALALWGYEKFRPTSILGSAALAILASLAILWYARSNLNVSETFPESLKVPLLRRFVA